MKYRGPLVAYEAGNVLRKIAENVGDINVTVGHVSPRNTEFPRCKFIAISFFSVILSLAFENL